MKETWVDLQVNGYGGIDFGDPKLTPEAVRTLTESLAAVGTEGYLAALDTMDPARLVKALRTIAVARRRYAVCERNVMGVFLEGPFISSEPGAAGAHDVAWVQNPDVALFGRFQDAAEGLIRMVNVAAEVPGMPDFVHMLTNQGVTVTLGHQLAKSPAELEPCLAAGASAFTHLGNGMPNEMDRHENVIFSALVENRASVMFIPDGHHLPDTLLKLFYRAVPVERLIAVSDVQYAAGLEPGRCYQISGVEATLEQDGRLWCPRRNCLVGSAAPLGRSMRHLREAVGLSESECRAIGHSNPLKLIERSAR